MLTGLIKTLITVAGSLLAVLCEVVKVVFSVASSATAVISTIPGAVQAGISLGNGTCIVAQVLGAVGALILSLLMVSSNWLF